MANKYENNVLVWYHMLLLELINWIGVTVNEAFPKWSELMLLSSVFASSLINWLSQWNQ